MKRINYILLTDFGLILHEEWTKVHKSVHEKVAAEDDGTLLCTFLKDE